MTIMMYITIFVSYLVLVQGGVAPKDALKDQYCTDPRTMRKYAAYTEWADAYSCTRHRCQPGGRNLAIYTVGCKRVEAPESAIECEEVVEDTNMQFPYCCTRLRCLVVVRGEVWTRVLGQPWETLPAAPWSHMYKMKKPPPVDGAFLPKDDTAGPVYELTDSETPQKVLRASKKEFKDFDDAVPRSAAGQTPDIVIALSTGGETPKSEKKRSKHKSRTDQREETPKESRARHDGSQREVRARHEEENEQKNEIEAEETQVKTEKTPEVLGSYEAFSPITEESNSPKTKPQPWLVTQAPTAEQWNEHDFAAETEAPPKNDAPMFHQNPGSEEKKGEKSGNLQALVDAIGTRMRDIETVVSRMSSTVQKAEDNGVPEMRSMSDTEKGFDQFTDSEHAKPKLPNPDETHHQRFTDLKSSSKYLHGTADITTEPPLFVEDANMVGYFSDASNNIHRRKGPMEPAATYMAPVPISETRRFHNSPALASQEAKPSHAPAQHKKHTHKKKKSKKTHKKHHKEEKKRINNIHSMEVDRNIVSLEDSGLGNQ